MKITTLIENKLGDRKDLTSEHGLSIYIEVDKQKILFDTGQSGDFIDNARQLSIDLKDLDHVFISHGHYDHSGGLKGLIEDVNPDFKLHLGQGFFKKKYSLGGDGEYDYIGNPFNEEFLLENNIDINYIKEDIFNLTENLMVFTNFTRKEEYENTNEDMFLEDDESYEKDLFLDEISLGIKTSQGLLVIVGCSHVGLVNILDTIIERSKMKIYGLIGGTHLVKEDDEKINKIIDYLKEKDISLLGACHCTGKQGETMFSQQLEEEFINNNTGDILEFK